MQLMENISCMGRIYQWGPQSDVNDHRVQQGEHAIFLMESQEAGEV